MNTPDLFSGLPGSDDDKVTVSLDGDAKTRAREKAKRVYVNTTPEEFQAMIDKATAEGRHTPGNWQTICSACRRWVDAIYYVSPQDRLARFCFDCMPADMREEILANRRKRASDEAEAAGVFDAPPDEAALPDGVERWEDIGLPE